MSTLYRKYRPQDFSQVVGQNHIKITLEQEIKTGRVAHAYLFCGPRAVGKTTLARVLAKAVNCLQRKNTSAEPCNKCSSCQEITQGRALDIIEIDAASNTGVDNVRDNIIASARVTPAKAKYKVFIIDEVHMLSISSFNALLKIIEEPPKFVIFILCTTEAHKVPATIISRCQRFDFKRISVNDVVKKLAYIIQTENIKINKGILEAIARNADGHMRDAESLLGQIVAIAGSENGRNEAAITQAEADLVIPRSNLEEVLNLLGFLIKKDASGGIRLINQLVDDGLDLEVFVKDVIEILRKLMLIKINPSLVEKLALELGEAVELKINKLAQDLNIEQILAFLEKFIKAGGELKDNFIQQLPLEIAIAEICTGGLYPRTTANTGPVLNAGGRLAGLRNSPAAAKPSANSQIKPDMSVNISSQQIAAKWSEVLAKVKQYNHSLSFILRVCQPQKIQGNQLCLAFKYKFHKDRVSETAIKNIVEKVLNQVYGAPLAIEAVIDENLEVAASKLVSDEPVDLKKEVPAEADGQAGNMIDNLLKTFGGKVIS